MTQKIFLADNSTATLLCPECNQSKTADLSKYKDLNKSVRLNIKCPCGNSYSVVLERRRHYRKEVGLPGTYTFSPPERARQKGAVTVKDLSRSGLKLVFKTMPELELGSILDVEFRLDDKRKSLIRKKVVVRRLGGPSVGVEFESFDQSDPSDNALGFYLF